MMDDATLEHLRDVLLQVRKPDRLRRWMRSALERLAVAERMIVISEQYVLVDWLAIRDEAETQLEKEGKLRKRMEGGKEGLD